MQFVFQPLAWGFLLALLPLFIHLINLMRHRRTEWAAMEFLLASYRKNRRWVWLKQALLIASRMLIVAITVAMLAQWVSGSKWLSLLSQSTTHHYFVLDDSASMGDMATGGSAYQNALGAIQTIAAASQNREGSHLITVIRTSRAQLAARNSAAGTDPNRSDESKDLGSEKSKSVGQPDEAAIRSSADAVADLMGRSIPTDPSGLLSKLMSTLPSSLDCNLIEALGLLRPIMQQSTGEKSIVYVLSDYRRKDWQNDVLVQQQLQSLPKSDLELQLVDCAPSRHENITLASIAPQQEVLVAGVPALINITVRNNGISPVRNLTVRVSAVDYSNGNIEQKPSSPFSGLTTELPPILIDRIEPGESVTRHTQVLFPKSGSHVVEAQLPPDPLLADNRARCVLDLQEGIRVLLVDGDATSKHSYFFESVLSPGGVARTGCLLTREGPEYLRDSDPSVLEDYACIIVQAVGGLDIRGIENLHHYVSHGGGLAVYFGELMTQEDFQRYNTNWTKAPNASSVQTPLLPFQIKGAAELAKSADESAPDFLADNHPIVAPLLGLSNSPFQSVRVGRYVEIDESLFGNAASSASAAKTWQSILTLRNSKPLLIDHSVGLGRVIWGMTALDRRWTNWPQDPTFVVTTLKTVGYLSSFRGVETSKLAGTSMRWDFSSQEMLPEIQVLCPETAASPIRPMLSINAQPKGETVLSAQLQNSTEEDNDQFLRTIASAGNFEWWGTSTQGNRVVRNMARNVAALEGEFDKTSQPEISQSLAGIAFTYKPVESINASTSLAGFANRNMLLMFLLIVFLLAEQWLAWSSSYHLPSK